MERFVASHRIGASLRFGPWLSGKTPTSDEQVRTWARLRGQDEEEIWDVGTWERKTQRQGKAKKAGQKEPNRRRRLPSLTYVGVSKRHHRRTAQKKKMVDRYVAFEKEKMADRRLAGSICRADTSARVCKLLFSLFKIYSSAYKFEPGANLQDCVLMSTASQEENVCHHNMTNCLGLCSACEVGDLVDRNSRFIRVHFPARNQLAIVHQALGLGIA
ncbi:hypothetical protein CERSUDRAFT_72487 [Gelatoporia subvermispora B]|uniref:Uncharacterized protein n=1 Tax=Ceriporiopsis subvermispora (strain B) TaxID=914234 RepID=M2RLH2_CERS8|nr:hypothetical protein CERSUDRAFT_72487 [Gelatoporia subvermispora B]